MIAWLVRAASKINPRAVLMAGAAIVCAGIGWQCRAVIAECDAQAIRLEWSAEREAAATAAILDRDKAIQEYKAMNIRAAGVEDQARKDRTTMIKMLGSIDHAKPLPADCHLDDERLRQLRAAP